MIILSLEDSQEPVLEEEIVDLERMISAQLPFDFKQFLKAHNGGYVQRNISFPIHDNQHGDMGLLREFYYLKPKRSYRDLGDIRNKISVFKDRMPQHLVPFACDPGGNQLCLSVREKDYGTIYFWAHEEEEDYEEDDGTADTYSGIYFVASSFTDFLAQLKEYSAD